MREAENQVIRGTVRKAKRSRASLLQIRQSPSRPLGNKRITSFWPGTEVPPWRQSLWFYKCKNTAVWRTVAPSLITIQSAVFGISHVMDEQTNKQMDVGWFCHGGTTTTNIKGNKHRNQTSRCEEKTGTDFVRDAEKEKHKTERTLPPFQSKSNTKLAPTRYQILSI